MRIDSFRYVVVAVVSAFALLFAPASWAQKNKKEKEKTATTIAVHVEGPDADTVRDQVLESVPKGVEVADSAEFQKALAKAGQRGQFGNAIAVAKARGKAIKAVKKALAKQDYAGAVIGRVRKNKTGGQEVYLVYVENDGGDATSGIAIDEPVALKGKSKDRVEAINAVLGPTLDGLAPAPEPEPEPSAEEKPEGEEPAEGEEEEKDDAPSDWKANHFATNIFSIGVGLEFGGRFFSYSRSPVDTPNIRDYDIFGPPLLSFQAELYPAASTSITGLRDLGIVANYARAFGITSSDEKSRTFVFDTSWSRFNIGARYRIRPGGPDSMLGLSLGFGILDFTLTAKDALAKSIEREVATVSYNYLRPGIDGRLQASDKVSLLGSFGYMAMLSSGQVYNRFTPVNPGPPATKGDASVGGIDLGVGLGIGITDGFEARLNLDYWRIFYAFSPQPGDTYVAGGALDQFLGIRLGAVYAY